jgi:hypothetical protein
MRMRTDPALVRRAGPEHSNRATGCHMPEATLPQVRRGTRKPAAPTWSTEISLIADYE